VILSEFFQLSGLECNVEKTVLMPINPDPVSDEIKSLGFEIKNNMTILGMKLKNNGDFVIENGEIITEKIQKQINYWLRFNLSLPGRITIAKSMLYSQINYLGSFIDFGSQLYARWEDLITRYVKGKLNIARDRFFLPLSSGGLGLFKIRNFLDAQRVGWLRLAQTGDKTWKQQLLSLTYDKISSGRSIFVDKNCHPTLHCFVTALDNIREAITVYNDNYKVSDILYNKNICKQFGTRDEFTTEFLNGERKVKLLRLKVSDIITFGINPETATAKSLEEVRILLPGLCNNKYRQLVDAGMSVHQLYKDNFVPGKKPESLHEILAGRKSNSKKIRQIPGRNITRYGEITETVPDASLSKVMNNIWGYSFLEKKIRTFAFKLFNNDLGTNARVAHFVRGHQPYCTFCVIAEDPDLEDESINHLFQDCPAVEQVVLHIINWFWGGTGMQATTRKDYMCGMALENKSVTLVWNIFVLILKFYIWDCKLKFRRPEIEAAKGEIVERFNTYCTINKFLNQGIISMVGLPDGLSLY
jgi:hypothetical protein